MILIKYRKSSGQTITEGNHITHGKLIHVDKEFLQGDVGADNGKYLQKQEYVLKKDRI